LPFPTAPEVEGEPGWGLPIVVPVPVVVVVVAVVVVGLERVIPGKKPPPDPPVLPPARISFGFPVPGPPPPPGGRICDGFC
jgi:hypothetical protein